MYLTLYILIIKPHFSIKIKKKTGVMFLSFALKVGRFKFVLAHSLVRK